MIDSLGHETVIASDVKNNTYLWNTREVEDGVYSIKIEGDNFYFLASDIIQNIIIKNTTSETKDNASLSYLFTIELLVVATIVIRRKLIFNRSKKST